MRHLVIALVALVCDASHSQGKSDSPLTSGESSKVWSIPESVGKIANGETFRFKGTYAASDVTGTSVVGWEEEDGMNGFRSVWASRYTPNLGWDQGVQISAKIRKLGQSPAWPTLRTALDDKGNGVLAWSDRSFNSIHLRTFSAGQKWGDDQVVSSTDATEKTQPNLILTSTGKIIVIWVEEDQNRTRKLVDNVYVPGRGWSGPQVITTADSIDFLIVAQGANNDAVAAWSQGPLFASRFTEQGGWSRPQQVTHDQGSIFNLAVAANGEAFIVRQAVHGSRLLIQLSHSLPGEGEWQKDAIVADYPFMGSLLGTPTVASDGEGGALIIAAYLNETNNPVVGGARLLHDGSITDASIIPHLAIPGGFTLAMSSDGHGNAVVVWGNGGYMTARYSKTSHVWSSIVPCNIPAFWPANLFMSRKGDVVAIWPGPKEYSDKPSNNWRFWAARLSASHVEADGTSWSLPEGRSRLPLH